MLSCEFSAMLISCQYSRQAWRRERPEHLDVVSWRRPPAAHFSRASFRRLTYQTEPTPRLRQASGSSQPTLARKIATQSLANSKEANLASHGGVFWGTSWLVRWASAETADEAALIVSKSRRLPIYFSQAWIRNNTATVFATTSPLRVSPAEENRREERERR